MILIANINSDNNCNNDNNKNNSVPPNKYKSNDTNSWVKHKTNKTKYNFNSNNDSENNNFNNGDNNNPLDNENHGRHVNNTRNTKFIVEDSIVLNLNGYVLTKKIVIQETYVKPTIREFNLNHIILHVGSNELKSSKTASQISRSVSDVALSLKSETNTVTMSLIAPQKNNLNNKQQVVNSRLIHMLSERDMTFDYHTDSNDYERHLNGSKVHLNESETTEFAKNVCEFLFQQD